MCKNKINKTALITGASSGIGYELTKLFAKDFYNLILVARNTDKLKEIQKDLNKKYNIDIIIITKDLSVPNAAVEIFNEIEKKQIVINILVNDAGIGSFGIFNNESMLKISQMIQVNITVLTELTRLFLKGMVERKQGKILNVSSLAAFEPGPYMAVYYATKAYVQSFSEAITNELKETGVTVTTLCPGPTKTGFQNKVGSENSNLEKLKLLSSSKKVAEYAYKSLLAGKEVAIPGFLNASLVNASYIIPRKVKANIIRKLQEFNRK
jgi:short-subunit dehydrogenase